MCLSVSPNQMLRVYISVRSSSRIYVVHARYIHSWIFVWSTLDTTTAGLPIVITSRGSQLQVGIVIPGRYRDINSRIVIIS